MMWNNACPLWNGGVFSSWGWIGIALTLLFWLALIAGLVYLVVWLVRRAGAQAPVVGPAAGPLSAREIAQVRYARGEIDRDEYLKLMEDL
jgi:putative membrane protein